MLQDLKQYEVWFVTGSQHLYGEETLKQVAEHSKTIVEEISGSGKLPVRLVFKPVMTSPDSIYKLCQEANNTENCIGIVAWMHTFSPAKMWISGLNILQKPICHLHTQFNQDIPWQSIDMDFMNLNQSAHGGREFGFINSRMRNNRKVIAGHWQNMEVIAQLALWTRVTAAKYDWQGAKFARIGDNMRQVAVTEGDKVAAEIKFGFSVNGYGIGDLVEYVNKIGDLEIETLIAEYEDSYQLAANLRKGGEQRNSLIEAARIELGLKAFLEEGNFKGFTDTFEDLHGLAQLPGIAAQRLMAQGYGFGGEGDWKTAALVRAMKVMGNGLKGGNSFMEDYTYHFNPGGMQVLGAHMLEICESIADGKPNCEIHPLSIGGKADPVRLVFNAPAGNALNASIIDMGNRFRLLINEVEATEVKEDLPKLPVARALWNPMPNLKTAAEAWILAGGAHHTCYSLSLTTEYLEDFAEMFDIETLVIDKNTNIRDFKNQIRWNEAYYHLSNGFMG
ncbi:L-arabinose isomerase [Flexithrix dorotheae]|uniref:L-arabinose isomerase n=1 Tax=Flexithrix dorotheae TaxID=70993 RepID=UPI00037C3281|nr:L-arabinose isomerase [Flexithrix dorotheae]